VHVVIADGAPHAPAWQVSPDVQALPSSHGVPSVCVGLVHTPA
jgi:hypothetical protein